MKIYLAVHCPCIYESGYVTLSLHYTKKGAYRAMRKHITDDFNDWREGCILYGKNRFGGNPQFDKRWAVLENEVLK